MEPSTPIFTRIYRFLKSKYGVIAILAIGALVLAVSIFVLTNRRSATTSHTGTLPVDALTLPKDYSPFRTPRADEGIPRTNVQKDIITKTTQAVDESIRYVGAQRNPDGSYRYVSHYDYLCRIEPTSRVCTTNKLQASYSTEYAWTAYAYLAAYHSYANPDFLKQALTDTLLLRASCAGRADMCRHVLVQVAAVYDETQNPLIKAFLAEEATVLMAKSEDNIMLKAIEARELAILYRIFRERSYIDEAIRRAAQVHAMMVGPRDTYTTRSPFSYPMESCWYALADYEIMKYTAPEKQLAYLKEVTAFLDNAQIEKNWNAFVHPVEIQPCIEVVARIGALTGNKEVSSYAQRLMDRFIADFWDSKSNSLNFAEGGTRYVKGAVNSRDITTRLTILTDSTYTVVLSSLFHKK